MTFQWTAGIAVADPCQTDNSTYEASSLTYSTSPLKGDTEVTGPIRAHIWAKLNGATDATLIAVLSDVNPQGQSTQLTAGFLLASQRALDPKLATYANGVMIRPWHPFTKASQQPVTPGQPELYEVEIYPTSNVFKAGDRIRLTIGTANTPGTVAPVPAAVNEVGGQLEVLRGPTYTSYVQLPVIPAGSVPTGSGSAPTDRCPLATGKLAGTRLGRVRLGMTRRQAHSALPRSASRRKGYTEFFCLTPHGLRVGYASPKLLKNLPPGDRRKVRGRIVWASTSNRFYSVRGVQPGTLLKTAARRLRLPRAVNAGPDRWYFTPTRASTIVLKVRRGRVAEIGIAMKSLSRSPSTRRGFVTSLP
jgi:hypothetical protein